jgi:hypothetical protein
MIIGVLGLMLAVAGCEGSKPGARPTGASSPSPSANAYIPPRLPADCEAVAAHIPAETVRDLRLIANPSPDTRLGQLVCSARGTSPDGGMKVYALFGVRVMTPDPSDPQGRRLSQWQHDNAESIIDAFCDSKVEPVTNSARYTVQCVKPEPDGASTGRGAVGADGRVAGAEVTVSQVNASNLDAARQFADRVAAAVVDAGLAAR